MKRRICSRTLHGAAELGLIGPLGGGAHTSVRAGLGPRLHVAVATREGVQATAVPAVHINPAKRRVDTLWLSDAILCSLD
ncbi:MAG: hypothetical protein GY820_14535 [Gammaproteobacteria bacterium]|nr:hypothetical protein [Gammaproteobacteria bacterium]